MKGTITFILFFLLSISIKAQLSDPIAMNKVSPKTNTSDTPKRKTIRNSESSRYSFIVSSDLKEDKLYIETNYTGNYKIRFIDYYARTKKIYKDIQSNISLDLGDFEKSIFILNIIDESNNKVLTSQIINLKRRHL